VVGNYVDGFGQDFKLRKRVRVAVPLFDDPAYIPRYVAALEARVEKLERLLKKERGCPNFKIDVLTTL